LPRLATSLSPLGPALGCLLGRLFRAQVGPDLANDVVGGEPVLRGDPLAEPLVEGELLDVRGGKLRQDDEMMQAEPPDLRRDPPEDRDPPARHADVPLLVQIEAHPEEPHDDDEHGRDGPQRDAPHHRAAPATGLGPAARPRSVAGARAAGCR
jgi:hypothetical protein